MMEIDTTALLAALDAHRADRNLYWRDVAHQTGLAASLFSRLKLGHGLDLNAYVICCHWLGKSLDTFTPPPPHIDHGLGTEVLDLLRRHNVPSKYHTTLTDLIRELATPEPTPPG
jgi:hypothetical protein